MKRKFVFEQNTQVQFILFYTQLIRSIEDTIYISGFRRSSLDFRIVYGDLEILQRSVFKDTLLFNALYIIGQRSVV